MSKEREELYFKWQRSSNLYMILLTLIIAMVFFLNSIPNQLKIYVLWILGFLISFFGLSVISLNADELVYTWKGLRDERKKVSKFKRITSLIVYLFIALMGFIIILIGLYLLLVLSGILPNPLS